MIEEKLEKRISCNNEFGGKIMKKKREFHGQETGRFNVDVDTKKNERKKKQKVSKIRDVDDDWSGGIRERRILGVGIEQKKSKN